MTAPTQLPAPAIVPLAEIKAMAQVAVQSRLFGVKSVDEALALMLLAQSEGLHPMKAVQQFHIIQGRPTMKAEVVLARFQAAGGRVQWEHSDAICARAVFSHALGGPLTVEWTIERAKQAGLVSKDSWKNYPQAMLRARVITEGVRAVFPGCTLGFHSEEEASDIESPMSEVVIGSTVADTVAGLSEAPALCTAEQAEALKKLMAEAGVQEPLRFISEHAGRPIERLSQLSLPEVEKLTRVLSIP